MNHPTQEELISFLYDEVSREKKSELTSHLQACPECQGKVSSWQNVQKDLTGWKIAAAPGPRFNFAHAIKWAAAAVFMLVIGFGFGRSSAPQVNADQLRAEIESRVQKTFQQELTAARETDRKAFIAMLRDVEEQRISEYSQLRKDLETVAVVADEKLTTTENALNQLHLIAQSDSNGQSKQ